MAKNKQYCENLYEKYKELKERTEPIAQEVVRGKEIEPKYVLPEEMEKFSEIKEEMKECLKFLKDDQLMEFYGESELEELAHKILGERRKNENNPPLAGERIRIMENLINKL